MTSDGTLTRTNEVDDLCFPLAFAENLGVTDLNTDWSATHSTDTWFFRSIRTRFRRYPLPMKLKHLNSASGIRRTLRVAPGNFLRSKVICAAATERDSRIGRSLSLPDVGSDRPTSKSTRRNPGTGLPMAFAEDGRPEAVEAALRHHGSFIDQCRSAWFASPGATRKTASGPGPVIQRLFRTCRSTA